MITPDTADLQYMFDTMSEPVLINDSESMAILTNANFLNKNDERYIHTLEPITLGDLITYHNEKYLVLTETTTKRYGKFKAVMRHCNFIVELQGEVTSDYMRDDEGNIIRDGDGRPIIIEIVGDPYFIPVIVDSKSFAVSGSQLLVADNEIIVTLQDNELTRGKFDTNTQFNLMDYNWKVTNIDKTRKGLLVLTCERVTG